MWLLKMFGNLQVRGTGTTSISCSTIPLGYEGGKSVVVLRRLGLCSVSDIDETC